MTKVFLKCLLTLLVLSGYSQVRANVAQNPGHHLATKVLHTEYAGFCLLAEKHAYSFIPASTGSKDTGKIYSEEKEEESNSLTPLKVLVSCGSYFSAFYTRLSGYCMSNLKVSLLTSTHWFYSSSSRSVILQVMRI